jgi:23S rRNA (cytidine1920-2'-O)/16S rRNA (cytidine1409-2'-O)-methyltransferase
MPARQRLDEALVARGLYASRARARDAVLRGVVLVDGKPAVRPSQPVASASKLTTIDTAKDYVSRAALKLKHAIAFFGLQVKGSRCLDIGASTGGFSQVLLEEGAAHVTAIDVGHRQMKLSDPRLSLIEGLNARDLSASHLSQNPDLIVCDVSFISLKLALPPALELAVQGAALVALIKPQFEVGREGVGKGGVVTSHAEQARVCKEIVAFLMNEGWSVLGVTDSPLLGGDGNQEFLVAARKA